MLSVIGDFLTRRRGSRGQLDTTDILTYAYLFISYLVNNND